MRFAGQSLFGATVVTVLALSFCPQACSGELRFADRYPSSACNGGFCSSVIQYPVKGTSYYAEFNVPKLPKVIGPTFFVYYNIDWQAAGPPNTDARMNQFVPQLMLGEPLDGSTGAPLYKPIWHSHKSWVFGAQYFFELFNETSNATEGHAATGVTYPCKEGEVLFTSFELSEDWVWSLHMGVKNDPSRLSTVVVERPFMGLLPPEQTYSWNESAYARAWSNTCWELYGISSADNYPGSDQQTKISISNNSTKIDFRKWSTGRRTAQVLQQHRSQIQLTATRKR